MIQSFHTYVQLPTLSSQVDVIHSHCASMNELDTSLDSYKYNHSSPKIKCTVLCFRIMFFICIEKNGWAAFLYFLSLSPSFFHSLSSIIPLSFILSLSRPLSFYQLPILFAIFMRQLFIYVSAQLDFIAYFFFSHFSTLETYSADPHAMQHGGDCDAQVTSVLGSITLFTSEPSSSLHHIYQSLSQQIKHIKALKGTSKMIWCLFLL